MARATEFLFGIRRIIRLYEAMQKEICDNYHLTQTEAAIIMFLHNNPGKDTAADIVELRRLQKSNVSQAVEMLVQKSLLSRQQDGKDRRKIHLLLTEEAGPVIGFMEELWSKLEAELFKGVSQEEWEFFTRINNQIHENIQSMTERSE